MCVLVSFYCSLEKDEILSDVASRLWFTYRKNFPAIGECPSLQRVEDCTPGQGVWLERAACLVRASVLRGSLGGRAGRGLARAVAEPESEPGAPGSGSHTASRRSLLGLEKNRDSE